MRSCWRIWRGWIVIHVVVIVDDVVGIVVVGGGDHCHVSCTCIHLVHIMGRWNEIR